MITVVLVSVITLLFVASMFVRNSTDFNRVSDDRRREQAIHDADGGLEHALYRIDKDPNWATPLSGTYPGPFASSRAERDWAINQVDTQVGAGLMHTVNAPDGEWAVIKPSGVDVIYGVGYLPSRAAARNIRVVRADYDFAPFNPQHALLTDGDLYLGGGSLSITGSAHANDKVTKVDGWVSTTLTSSGSCPPGCTNPSNVGTPAASGGGKPLEVVPLVNPRENYRLSQYDMCPVGDKGVIKKGPAHPTGNPSQTEPCTGTLLAQGDPGMFGWKGTGKDTDTFGNKWDVISTSPTDGVYYILHGSLLNVAKTTGTWRATIFAEAKVPSGAEEKNHCPHVGGDIIVQGNPRIEPHLSAYPLLLVAGRDLQISGDPSAGQTNYGGVLAAHEQVQMNGNPSVHGVALSNDYCGSEKSSVKTEGIYINGNPSVTYSDLDVPFGKTIRLARWLEL